MKLSNKQTKILSGILSLIGVIVSAYTSHYNETHENDPNNYGHWIGIFFLFVGLILLMPWNKEKK